MYIELTAFLTLGGGNDDDEKAEDSEGEDRTLRRLEQKGSRKIWYRCGHRYQITIVENKQGNS